MQFVTAAICWNTGRFWMTWEICALLLTARLVGGAEEGTHRAAETGAVEGGVTFRGEVPKANVPDDAGVRRPLLKVDRESRGLEQVVVWLEVASSGRLVSAASAEVDQRNHEFVPRVLAVQAGQAVRFTNSDLANHNVRTASVLRTNEFNVYTGPDSAYTHRFVTNREMRPVRVGCDIHPWMGAWIYVFEHGYFAVTDAKGRFRIEAIPPGRYKLSLRQPDIGYRAEREVVVTRNVTARIDVEVEHSTGKSD